MTLTKEELKVLKSVRRAKNPIITLVKLYKKNPSVTIELRMEDLTSDKFEYQLSDGLSNNDEISKFSIFVGTLSNRLKLIKSYKSREAFKTNLNEIITSLK